MNDKVTSNTGSFIAHRSSLIVHRSGDYVSAVRGYVDNGRVACGQPPHCVGTAGASCIGLVEAVEPPCAATTALMPLRPDRDHAPSPTR